MIPSPQEIARQLAALCIIYPEETTSQLAGRIGLPPAFVINAIHMGRQMELLEEDKAGDKITALVEPDLGPGAFGEEMERLQMEIHILLHHLAEDEEDIEEGKLRYWLRGVNPSSVDIILYAMERYGLIEKYKLADSDDTESAYTFISLKAHAANKWGKKQFKKEPLEVE